MIFHAFKKKRNDNFHILLILKQQVSLTEDEKKNDNAGNNASFNIFSPIARAMKYKLLTTTILPASIRRDCVELKKKKNCFQKIKSSHCT